MASNEKNFKVKLGVTTPKVDYTLDDKVITAEMLDLTTPTLSYSGSAGQLFSISDDLTGTIFSVNDISGIPSIEVNADGTVSLAEFDGNVGIGTATPTQKLDVAGAIRTNDGIYSSTDLILGSNDTAVAYVKTSGEVGIGTDTPTSTLDVDGTARIRTVSNATGDFATLSATGVIQKRTAAETLSDIGAASSGSLSGYLPLTGGTLTDTLTISEVSPQLFLNKDPSSTGYFSLRSNNVHRWSIMYTAGEAGGNSGADLWIRSYDDSGGTISNVVELDRSTSDVSLANNLSVGGNINVTGTVDGVDIASFKSSYDSHTHAISDVTGLQTSLDGKANLSGATFTGNVNLIPTGGSGSLKIEGSTGNPNIELGLVNGTASTPFIDFHSGTTLTDFDARIIASGGSGTLGQGTLQLIAGDITLSTQGTGSTSAVRADRSITINGTTQNLQANRTWTLTAGDVGAAASSHTHPVSEVSDSTTLGQNLIKFANPGAIRFIRINADNTVTARTAADFRGDIGAGTSSTTGTVTSVAAGNGLDFTTITGSGSVTLGTPGSLTGSSTNSVTATSHTHAVSLSASDVGAVDKTGDTMTGSLTVPGTLTLTKSSGVATLSSPAPAGGNDPQFIRFDESVSNSGYVWIAVSDDFDSGSSGDIFYIGDSNLTDYRFKVLGNGSSYVTTGSVAGANLTDHRIFADNYHPNADAWTTSRTVTFATGDVTGSFSIDGSADVSNVALTVADNSHNHTTSNITDLSSYTGFDSRYYTETEVDGFAVKLTGDQTISGVKTFRNANAIRVESASTQDAIILSGRAGGSSSYAVTITPGSLTGPQTLTLPNDSGTVALSTSANIFTVGQLIQSTTAGGLIGLNGGLTIRKTSGGDAINLQGNDVASNGSTVFLVPTTLTADRTLTLPDASGTLARIEDITGGGFDTAGNGLTSSGSTVSMGTPSTLTASTSNATTSTSHTHEITGFLPLTGGTLTGDLIAVNIGIDTSSLTNGRISLGGSGNNSGVTFNGGTGGTARIFKDGSNFYVGARGGTAANGLLIEDTTGKTVAQSGLDVTGAIEATSTIRGSTVGTSNTSSSSGQGISLYGGPYTGFAPYSIMFAGPATYGTHGGVTGDWATYFVINNSSTRGWIWKAGTGTSGNVFSVSGGGVVTVTGTLIIPSK